MTARALATEAVGSALLVATVIGSGIMAEWHCGCSTGRGLTGAALWDGFSPQVSQAEHDSTATLDRSDIRAG